MTTLSASLTNRTLLLPQSRDSSRHVSEVTCPPRPAHLPLLHMVDSTDHVVTRSDLFLFWLPMRKTTGIRKNTGTYSAPIVDTHTHCSTRIRLRALFPLVT